jgi:Ca-activated chloride channel homolog
MSTPLPLIDSLDVARSRCLGILSVVRNATSVALPLAGVDITASVADRVAGVTVLETFRNPYQEHLEAVYTFPLAGGSAVSDFELRVGSRTVRGVVKERGEARREYQQALDDGKRAALLEQERDDVFTVQVGNLPPGEEVTVKITYSERLPFFEDGSTELRLPLVVAPRYIPGTPTDRGMAGDGTADDTDVVPDASRITPPRLAPGFDPKVSLGLSVELVGGTPGEMGLDDLSCSQHATKTSIGNGVVRVALAREDEPLDRDFVLRWRLAGESTRSTFLVHHDAEGGSFGMVSVAPPRRDGFLGTPRDVVFVVDRSGSMGGVKMASAARACSVLLGTLGPRDRFAIQAFDNVVEWMPVAGDASGHFFAADEAGIVKGDEFLRGIDARGGTELDGAVGAAIRALAARSDTAGRAPVIVVLTDGEIGDESRVLKRIQRELGDARVFTVGIDTAVNDGFLRRLASLGGGTATFVEPGLQLEDALRAVGREIGRPLVVDLRVEDVDAGLDAASLAPSRVPDLFAGRATTAFLRTKTSGRVRVRGRFADGGEFDETITAREVTIPALVHLWARARVAELEDRFRIETGAQAQIKQEIVDLSVRHSLLTRFTAFVVVDEAEVVNPDGTRRKVVQPVAMPARWEMQDAADASITFAGGPPQQAFASFAPPMPVMAAPASAPPPPAGTGSLRGAPPAPQAPRGGGLGSKLAGAVDALGDLFGGSNTAKRRQAPPPPPLAQPPLERRKMEEGGAGVSAHERTEIQRAFTEFANALTAARKELEAGRLPSPLSIDRARSALLDRLSKSDLGMDMPALQRYLRASAIAIVAALATPGITAAQALAVLDQHARAFEEARAEALAKLGGSGDPGAFWEGSI